MSVYTYNDFSNNYFGCTQVNNSITYNSINTSEIISKISEFESKTKIGLDNISNTIEKTGNALRDAFLATSDMAILRFLAVTVAKIQAVDLEMKKLGKIWDIPIKSFKSINKDMIMTYETFVDNLILNEELFYFREYFSEFREMKKCIDGFGASFIYNKICSYFNSDNEFFNFSNKYGGCNTLFKYLENRSNTAFFRLTGVEKVRCVVFEKFIYEIFYPNKLRDLYNKELLCLLDDISKVAIEQEFAFNELQYKIQEKRSTLLSFQNEIITSSDMNTNSHQKVKQLNCK